MHVALVITFPNVIAQEPMPQTSIKIDVTSLHLILLARFLYDMKYFAMEVWAMSEGLRHALQGDAGSPDAGPKGDACHCTTTEVLQQLLPEIKLSYRCLFKDVEALPWIA